MRPAEVPVAKSCRSSSEVTVTTTSGSEVGTLRTDCSGLPGCGIGHAVELLDDMAIRSTGRERCFLLRLLLGGHRRRGGPDRALCGRPDATMHDQRALDLAACQVLGGRLCHAQDAGRPGGRAAAWAGTALAASPVPTSTAADAAMDRCAFFWVVEFMQSACASGCVKRAPHGNVK